MRRTIEIELRRGNALSGPVAAWLLGGADPAAWVREVAEWDVSLAEAVLYVLPRVRREACPGGALVTFPSGASPQPGPQSQPYVLRAGRVYLPADGVLHPTVTDAELSALCGRATWVWTPGAGPIAFTEEQRVRAMDLLRRPSLRGTRWDRARPGVALNTRLCHVEPDRPVMQMMEPLDAEGPPPPPLVEPPPAPDLGTEANASGVKELIEKAQREAREGGAVAGIPEGVAKTLGAGALERLKAWFQAVKDACEQGLARLLSLLDSDPDQALRIAIPLVSRGARGAAPPGAGMVPRDPTFRMEDLKGGGPASAWPVKPEIVEKLRARYRELANRDMQIGRYRRAAYIFAVLLGDDLSAAGALRAGGHFLDAGILYRDVLKNHAKDAAECFLKHGDIAEAARLLLTVDLLRAGDLYRLVGMEEEARAAYEARVAALRRHIVHFLLDSAYILETRLHRPEEALKELLNNAFRGFTVYLRLEQEVFRLLGLLGRHEEAAARVRKVQGAQGDIADVASVLQWVARNYAQASVRALAQDALRVHVGRRLDGAKSEVRWELGMALIHSSPGEHILSRDVQRYLEAESAPKAPPARAIDRTEVPIQKTHAKMPSYGEPLGTRSRLCMVAARGSVFYAVEKFVSFLSVLRGRWNGSVVAEVFRVPQSSLPLILEPHWNPAMPVMLFAPGGPRFPLAQFAPLPIPPQQVGTPTWIPEDALGLAYGESGTVWVVRGEAMSLFAYMLDGRLLGTDALPGAGGRGLLAVDVLARHHRVLIAAGDRLILRDARGKVTFLEFDQPIRGMAVPHSPADRRVALTFDSGGRVVWLGPSPVQRPFARDLSAPKATFTVGDRLVVATSDEVRIYVSEGDRLIHQTSLAGIREAIVAVTATHREGEFAVFPERFQHMFLVQAPSE